MDLEDIILSENTHSEKDKHGMISLICARVVKITDTESGTGISRGGTRTGSGELLNG